MHRGFGLIGKSLGHSFSAAWFREKFRSLNLPNCSYENFELFTLDELLPLLKSRPDIEGLNVTIPFKEEIISYLHWQHDVVQQVKACNCIRIRDGKLFGYNTDVTGWKKSIEKTLKPWHTKALVFGSGGASKAVQFVLRQLRIEHKIVSRNRTEGSIGYEDLNPELMSEYLLLINTTPVGSFPNVNDLIPLPYDLITDRHFLYDLVYNPPKTEFLKMGEKQGAQIMNGYEMLVIQAEESWKIWNVE